MVIGEPRSTTEACGQLALSYARGSGVAMNDPVPLAYLKERMPAGVWQRFEEGWRGDTITRAGLATELAKHADYLMG